MGKGKPMHGIVFAQVPGYTRWVMHKDGETPEPSDTELQLELSGKHKACQQKSNMRCRKQGQIEQ